MNIKTVRLNGENHNKLLIARDLLIRNGFSKLRKKGIGTKVNNFQFGTVCGIALELLIKELEGDG